MHHHPTKSIEPQVRYARPANKGMYDPLKIQVAGKYCHDVISDECSLSGTEFISTTLVSADRSNFYAP